MYGERREEEGMADGGESELEGRGGGLTEDTRRRRGGRCKEEEEGRKEGLEGGRGNTPSSRCREGEVVGAMKGCAGVRM